MSIVKEIGNRVNGNDYFTQELSPTRHFPNFNLPPDFFIYQFYLGNATLTNPNPIASKEINFAGNHIQVLNSFIPGNLETFANFLGTKSDQTVQITNTELKVNPQTILILPTLSFEVKYSKIYHTLTKKTLDITNGGDWAFVENTSLSTPILVMLSRDVRPVTVEAFREKDFRYSLGSTIPDAFNGADLTCWHGYNDIVKVAIMAIDVINPLTVNIYQTDQKGTEWLESSLAIVSPYHNIVTLPRKVSGQTRVEVEGGGALETGSVEIDFILNQE